MTASLTLALCNYCCLKERDSMGQERRKRRRRRKKVNEGRQGRERAEEGKKLKKRQRKRRREGEREQKAGRLPPVVFVFTCRECV